MITLQYARHFPGIRINAVEPEGVPLAGAELAGLDLGHGGGVARNDRAQVGQRHADRLTRPPHLGAEEVQRRGAWVEIALGGHAGLLLAGACRGRSGFANG